VEVELTVKAPRRLLEICRAWARCRCVAGVIYLAPPEVARALGRAIEKAQAHERVVVVALDALGLGAGVTAPSQEAITGGA
jgi:ribosome biogenesis protein Nip4